MTRAISIANLSNWDGEDYVIRAGDDVLIKPGVNGFHDEVTIAPGETCQLHFCEGEKSVAIEAVQREGVDTPLYLNGKQVYPFLVTGYR